MVNLGMKDQEPAESPNTLKESLDSKIQKETLVNKRANKIMNSDLKSRNCLPSAISLHTHLCLGYFWSIENSEHGKYIQSLVVTAAA